MISIFILLFHQKLFVKMISFLDGQMYKLHYTLSALPPTYHHIYTKQTIVDRNDYISLPKRNAT